MKDDISCNYPGANASPQDILSLAAEYHSAAEDLVLKGRTGEPISRAPARLCAIHAVELYFNAFLLHCGEPPETIRGHFHNLALRATSATEKGLVLRKKTLSHLERMTDDREYLVTRYGPELCNTVSQVNRLMATLSEVAKKVRTQIENPQR